MATIDGIDPPDLKPDGEPIDTRTIWLPFPNGEVAISMDFTRFNAAMRRAAKAVDRLEAAKASEEPA